MTTPYYTDERAVLHHGDCLDVLAAIPDASVDAIVTDPPYGLGFMGEAWDDLPPGLPWAVECLRVLKPGGHLLAFGGTRTWHRLACAVEDAGFEMRDSIAWLYGSGFPKSLDVSKAIDKAAGAEREVVGRKGGRYAYGFSEDARDHFRPYGGGGFTADPSTIGDITAPATPDAQRWQGWGTALKPAFEPVVCARKPFSAVPLGEEVDRLHHLIGGLLWLSLSPAKRAELTSPSSPAGQHEATCVSALVSAALDASPDASDETATYNSPALASTSSSIASSWSATLGALSARTRTSTTSTASSTTTALRTLNSLLGPITSQTTMPKCGCLVAGPSSHAPSAASSSSDEWAKWLHTLSASVPESATEGIALAVASALASIAVDLSADLDAASSAGLSATTSTATRTGSGTSAPTGGSSPAFEPVVVARKPLAGTVAANVLAHGTGALNVDGCRVGAGLFVPGGGGNLPSGGIMGRKNSGKPSTAGHTSGRWPANVVLGHTPDCDVIYEGRGEIRLEGPCAPGCPVAELDRQSGEPSSRVGKPRGAASGDGWGMTATGAEYADSGGASRFFYTTKAPSAERPKAGKVAHPTVKPLDLMRWLVRLVTPPGGVVLDPFAGSGTTIEAAIVEGFRCIGIEREADYLPLIDQRIARACPPLDFTEETA